MPNPNNQMIPGYNQPYMQSWNTNPYGQSYQQPQYAPQVSGALPQYSYQAQPNRPQTDIKWVQGKAGAKAYVVEPGKSVILMDSETDHFYIKSADPSGMPLPLRVFAYKEEAEEATEQNRSGHQPDMSKYITKDDIKNILEEYLGPMKKEG